MHHPQKVAKEIIKQNLPLFGICLGHQIIALANGIPTYKMFNGHRGINHPVMNLKTGKGEITSQNHGFAVDKSIAESNKDFEVSHIHLNDQTVAGLRMKNKNCFQFNITQRQDLDQMMLTIFLMSFTKKLKIIQQKS